MKIFVYGTLRKNQKNYNKFLKGLVISTMDTYIIGKLYSLKNKDYPALISGNRFIKGELLEINDNPELLNTLSKLEGFIESGNINNEYNLVEEDIYNDNFKFIGRYQTFKYNEANDEIRAYLDKVIEENDFCKYMSNKRIISE
ncbi:MAG: gamma-glutamylcyclotransferase [Anaerorhabdus sp.]